MLTFPKGLLPEPTRGQRLFWLLKDNLGLLLALLGVLVLLGYCIVRWWQIGRDPQGGPIVVRYDPPAQRTPAELRFLKRGCGYDTRCLTADLLALAVDGRVQLQHGNPEDQDEAIDAVPGLLKSLAKKLLEGRKQWSITRLDAEPDAEPAAPSTATVLLKRLLPKSRKKLVFDEANQRILQSAKMAHYNALDKRLKGSHYRRNGGSFGIALLIAIAFGVLAFALADGSGLPAILGLCGLMAIILIVFARLIPAPTAEGRRLLDEIEGLRRYLGVAERDELKNLPGPNAPPPLDAERYQRLLPYAIALDVEEAWSKQFTLAIGAAAAAAATAGIAWYRGGSFDSIGSLANAVGSGLNSSIASASSAPGSSSGSGGGGSSGGGGGGGGGGGR